ncbi:anhydro-N-acetylmuramic acid kinase [Synechococcus sp. MVIR-18-1]|uniref:anhydro-N-acetylmuramic acid kinase n=1 Tax=Synechococcus sp. MVIR-18-1 TaxID=1386941 RepID=UPI0016489C29|nr:anhydro-N-acetylmuramic acid kinase [Synechococcus sp. MVIR-18-1]QNI77641.1 anhydro-N-acetylmuramic acid kinase [Synechococcus sp. MVIR-18-1]
MRVLGLMSGTSADGVDAVLVELSGSAEHPHWTLLRSASLDYPASTRQLILAVGQGEAKTASTLLNLSETITKIQAAAARQCDPEGQAQLVGCHGQTLWHRPPENAETGALQPGASWQMLQAPLLAQLLKRPVIFDFRAADLALGGQGAPLVPKADAALLGRTKGWRALLNLGGIANLTLIPPDAGPDRLQPVRGWDCGPANSLIDLAMEQFSEGKESCDESGRLAETGQCDEALILRWLAEPYFQLSPPKSTGRELFGRADLTRRLQEMQGQAIADQIATLTAFSAAVVAQDLQQLSNQNHPLPIELLVAGGGSQNLTLMRELTKRCRGLRLRRSDELRLPSQSREAMVFALLAWWHHLGYPGNAPAITGAEHEAVLGVRVNPA